MADAPTITQEPFASGEPPVSAVRYPPRPACRPPA